MGFICGNIRILLAERRKGVSFRKTILIGRQQIFLRPCEIKSLAREFPEFKEQILSYSPSFGEFSERWLKTCLGSEIVDSVDASDFEGATIVHDMNIDIEHSKVYKQVLGAYDAVIDAGSLEHVFNVPIALKNCMKLVKPGGFLCLASVTNNYCGHGFYQFSPELYFRILQPENGFDDLEVLLLCHPYPGAELSRWQKIYQVKDPIQVGNRVGLVSRNPVMIIASAIRKSDAGLLDEIFEASPQQSDYQKRWDQESPIIPDINSHTLLRYSAAGQVRRVVGYLFRKLKSRLPTDWQQSLTGIEQRRVYSLSNRKHFTVWKP
jgi:SAM-dependent methyltransferase